MIQDSMLCAGGNSRDACEVTTTALSHTVMSAGTLAINKNNLLQRDGGSPLTCTKGVQVIKSLIYLIRILRQEDATCNVPF